jgi:hypothetical protein
MKYALISQRQMIEIESAFETKRLFATVKDIETIDKALKILHLLKFSDAVEITGAELAKPEQEPVGWFLKDHLETYLESYKDIEGAIPLYTAPLRKPWVGLTGTEINHIFAANVGYPERMCRAIEAKLKEKNGG